MNKKMNELKCDVVRINGMTCTSCEVIIERKLKKIRGVEKVNVNHHSGVCKIYTHPNTTLSREEIQQLIADNGYTVESLESQPTAESIAPKRKWAEIGVALCIVFALYLLFKALGVFSVSTTINQSIGYGAVFVIGLVAAVSTCIAVVGGLLLSVTAQYTASHPHASGWQKFKPHLLFNTGRLISYFVLGGVIGVLGKVIAPSPRFTGVLTIAISIVMIFLAIDILKVFKTKRFIPRMPKWMSHKIHTVAEYDRPWTPFILGALTFFLPCGFTQSMQLYALTTGSFLRGGLIMFIFALGTLPTLLGLGMVSSVVTGKMARYFLTVSGVVVLLLGVYNLSNGFVLAGVSIENVFQTEQSRSVGGNVELKDGKQIIAMDVDGYDYVPAHFTLQKGVPVEWHINASQAEGCAQVMTIPKLGVSEYLSTTEETVITFTPKENGSLPFMCSMGMSRGVFTIVDAQ